MPYFALIIMFYHVKIACYHGNMFPRSLSFVGDVAAQWALDAIAMCPSRGRGVHRIDLSNI